MENLRLIERAESSIALNALVLDEEPHAVVERRSDAWRLFAQQNLHRIRSNPAVDALTTRDVNTTVRVLAIRQSICHTNIQPTIIISNSTLIIIDYLKLSKQ